MGPLKGFKIIEIAGIGPSQFAGMLLADMGASLIRIERPVKGDLGVAVDARFDLMNRSRPAIPVDLKTPHGIALVLELCKDADALFEGFRPGVMERLGLGPNECMAQNPKLVFGRMTGWGQDGPLANTVGHDHNYISLTGVLASIGEKGGAPVYPLNLIADMGGGGAFLVMGILAALLESGKSGQGQVVDAAMIDGAASTMTLIHGLLAAGIWTEQRGSNILDGGAPYATTYRTKDEKYIMIAAIENRFYRVLLEKLEIVDIDPDRQNDKSTWDQTQHKLQVKFESRTRAEWCDILEGTDACFSSVLGMSEAIDHPHNRARNTYINVDGIMQPAPAPRFSRTLSKISSPAGPANKQIGEVLEKWGASDSALRLAESLVEE